MALNFTYRLVQSTTTGTSNSATDFAAAQSTGGTTNAALADNTVGIYGHGTALDQSRQYYLELYVQESDTHGNRNYFLDGLDLSIDFTNNLFKTTNGASFQHAAALDLFNSRADVGTHGIRFTSAAADQFSGGATSIQLNNGQDNFIGRVQVDVDDAYFNGDGYDYTGSNSTQLSGDAGNLANFVDLTVNSDNTVIRTQNNGGQVLSVETFNDYQASRGSSMTETSATTVALESGQISTNVQDVFDNFYSNAYLGNGDNTNLVRAGQTLSGSFDVTNIGNAGLTGLQIQGGTAANSVVDFTTASVDNAVAGGSASTHAISSVTGGYSIAGAEIESGQRDNVTGESTGTADTMTVNFTSTINSNAAAGSVAEVDFSTLTMTANGENAESVFGSEPAVIKNLVTYKSDLTYDGKVSMMDLAVMNAANKNGVVNEYTNVDSDVSNVLDLNDLAVMVSEFGQSLWVSGSGDTAGYQDASATMAAMLDSQNSGQATEVTWDNDAFTDSGAATQASATAGTLGLDAGLFTASSSIAEATTNDSAYT